MAEVDGARADVRRFGFRDEREAWLDHLVEAMAPADLGSIGPYEVLEEVARGGQGIVYRARQCGTRREIALKRLVEGRHATASAKRRFDREIEVAATLDHPGVVTVYGVEEVDGVPVVAMQWIDGAPTDAWARDVPDGAGARQRVLRLFLRVCDAVEHAHRRGVLHLDLKPTNVLVDAAENPHVLDFGLALSVDRDAERTRSGAFLGTLAYASPEQLEGARRRLDVRSDVYSLGVILFEMVTGARPFAFHDGVAPALAAKQRGDLSFPRPSGLGRELEAILRRALAARREERYPTVAALAEDVRRLLDGRPVLAHPPGVGYELRKLARRHRPASALALVSVLLLAAVALQSWRHAAELRVERNAQAEARRDAEESGRRAEVEAERASGVLAFLLDDLFELALPQNLGADLTLGELLDVASERGAERFADRPTVEARVRRTLGRIYSRLGRYADAERELRRTVRLLEDAPAPPGERSRAWLRLGQLLGTTAREEEALAAYAEAEAQGDLPPALGVELDSAVGMASLSIGRIEEAAASFERALSTVEEHGLGDDHRLSPRYGLGLARAKAARFAEARAQYDEALADAVLGFGRHHERVADVLAMRADLSEAQGRIPEAIDDSLESLRILEGVYGDAHPVVAAALGDLGTLYSTPDRLAEGERLIERAVAINVETRGDDSLFTAMHRCRLGRNLVLQARPDEAIEVLDPAIARIEELRGPSDPWVRAARESRAMAYHSVGRQDEAIAEIRRLRELHDATGHPAFARSRLDHLLAQMLTSCGGTDEAGDVLVEVLSNLYTSRAMQPARLEAEVVRWLAWYRRNDGSDVADRVERRAHELGVLE